MSDQNRALVAQFWELMDTNDFQSVGILLDDDFALEWPQSRERIRGRDNFACVNEQYPSAGRWVFRVQTIVADDLGGVSDVVASDGSRADRAVTFFDIRDGRNWHMVEYWPEPFDAPQWRIPWVERE